MSSFIYTRSQILDKTQNSLMWEMVREAALVRNAAIAQYETSKDFTKVEKEKIGFPERKYLHSQSYQAAYQRAFEDVKAFFKALKSYAKTPSKFTGKPRMPKPDKFISTVEFKGQCIRRKGRFLIFPSKLRDNPIKILYSEGLPMPIHATLSLRDKEWQLNLVYEEDKLEPLEKTGRLLSIDLGVKRIAATFDGEQSSLYSNKHWLSLDRLHSKKKSEYNQTVGKRKLRGILKQIALIKRKKKDFLHKCSKRILDEAVSKGCDTIIFGDCSSIHQSPNLGKINNQKVSSNPDQQLRKYVEEKAERIGVATKVAPENYSSQTCPVCELRHKPRNRVFKCKCGFQYDRDSLGALNIYRWNNASKEAGIKNVSFIGCRKTHNERSGSLAEPIALNLATSIGFKNPTGIRFDARLSLFSPKGEDL